MLDILNTGGDLILADGRRMLIRVQQLLKIAYLQNLFNSFSVAYSNTLLKFIVLLYDLYIVNI